MIESIAANLSVAGSVYGGCVLQAHCFHEYNRMRTEVLVLPYQNQ